MSDEREPPAVFITRMAASRQTKTGAGFVFSTEEFQRLIRLARLSLWYGVETIHHHDGEWLMVINMGALTPRPWFVRWDGIEWENQRGVRTKELHATHWRLMPTRENER